MGDAGLVKIFCAHVTRIDPEADTSAPEPEAIVINAPVARVDIELYTWPGEEHQSGVERQWNLPALFDQRITFEVITETMSVKKTRGGRKQVVDPSVPAPENATIVV
jgi:hypothetical protein